MCPVKLRTRIMLLYTGLSLLVLGVLLPVVYTAFSAAQYRALAADLKLAGSQVFSCLEEADGAYSLDAGELELADAQDTFCVLQEDALLYAARDGQWLSGLTPPDAGLRTSHGGADWLVQAQRCELNETHFLILTAGRLDRIAAARRQLVGLLLLLVPLYAGLTAACSYLLARRALRPIHSITQTALAIESGGLNRRISGIKTRDEVGELAQAFNAMLDQLEVSFQRERQFTSDASHELRTPLAIISACAEKSGAACREEDLAEIRRECAYMTRLISQLLMLSRGYEGRVRFAPESIALFDVADSVCAVLQDEAGAQGICLENQVPPQLLLQADQSLLTQLVMNLAGNAVKYGRPGGHVWIDAAQGPEYVELRVADDGIGISAADQAHIFERFYRASQARDRTGTGLGLAIAQWIAALHGGGISVKSAPGHGSCFTVRLPQQAP